MKEKLSRLSKKDISAKIFVLSALLLSAARLLLAANQMVYIIPGSAPIDDDLFFNRAVSIVRGDWLGEYGPMTLTKRPFFAIWLAFLHILGIPYLVGNCLLWILRGALAVLAFRPVCRRWICRLFLFGALIFNPMTWADYNMRVYRDAIYPCICALFFICVAGRAMRINGKLSSFTAFGLAGGLFLGLSVITREDGHWLLPFLAAAILVSLVYICRNKALSSRILRAFLSFVPVFPALLCVLTICTINYKYYGLFKLDDFTSGPFADFYGAMTRFPREDPLVDVPQKTREIIYDACPDFRPFKGYLDRPGPYRTAFSNPDSGDFRSGYLYWAIRRVAGELGIYDSPKGAREYFSSLAREINRLRDRTLGTLPKRRSITPPIKSGYIVPVIKTTGQEVAGVLFYTLDTKAWCRDLSDVTTGKIDLWQDFLKRRSNYQAVENRRNPYHTPFQDFIYRAADAVTFIYRILTFPLFLLAVFSLFRGILKFKTLGREKQILLIGLLGLLGMGLLRLVMMAFMEVSAFGIGIYGMYLGRVWPALILVNVLAPCLFEKED